MVPGLELRPSGTLLFFEAPSFYDAVRMLEGEVARYKYDEEEVDKELHMLLRKWQDYLTRTHSPAESAASDAIRRAVRVTKPHRED